MYVYLWSHWISFWNINLPLLSVSPSVQKEVCFFHLVHKPTLGEFVPLFCLILHSFRHTPPDSCPTHIPTRTVPLECDHGNRHYAALNNSKFNIYCNSCNFNNGIAMEIESNLHSCNICFISPFLFAWKLSNAISKCGTIQNIFQHLGDTNKISCSSDLSARI